MEPRCEGHVAGLRSQLVAFTGTTYVDGEHWTRDNLEAAVYAQGGSVVPRSSRSRRMTLLVLGDLDPGVVTDPVRNRSQTAVFVDNERAHGNHICIVDDRGISSLLRREPAACLRTRGIDATTVEVSQPPPRAPRLVSLNIAAVPVHDPTGLDLDLNALDEATAAHQETLRALADHLAPTVLYALSTPKADGAWTDTAEPSFLMVAEVKSLTGARESQQIRLGIGQVLEYAHLVRTHRPDGIETVTPVLVLQREPAEAGKWLDLASSLGITLIWGPDFAGL